MDQLLEFFTQISDAIDDTCADIPPNELEIEGRLGMYSANHKKFSSNIGELFFKKIQKLLSYIPLAKLNATQELIDQKDFFSGALRLSVCNNQKKCIEKRKLCTYGLTSPNLCMDVRIQVSHEIERPLESFPMNDLHTLFCRTKKRLRTTLDNVHIDLTEVIEYMPGASSSRASDRARTYKSFEYEIEIADNTKELDTFYAVERVFVKLYDALVYCKDESFVKNSTNHHDFAKLLPMELVGSAHADTESEPEDDYE